MTNPATQTKSMGLLASARGVMVFAEPLINYILTFNFCPSTGTGKNHATATQTATNQTAGPLWAIALIMLQLPRQFR